MSKTARNGARILFAVFAIGAAFALQPDPNQKANRRGSPSEHSRRKEVTSPDICPGCRRVAERPENQEVETMKCGVCGGETRRMTTDLPFKVSDTSIVILKDLPVIQCAGCPEYLLEDEVLRRVDVILSKVDGRTELEVIRYAA